MQWGCKEKGKKSLPSGNVYINVHTCTYKYIHVHVKYVHTESKQYNYVAWGRGESKLRRSEIASLGIELVILL